MKKNKKTEMKIESDKSSYGKSTRILAIFMICTMVIFTFITAGMFILN